MPSVGFYVYVDESGDEGFIFNADGTGSSRWFVLSAVITRKETDLDTVKLIDQVRADFKRTTRNALHFRHLRHEQRVAFATRIAAARLRTVSVLIHKPSIDEPEKFSEKYMLYRYATRFLLERVSWFCRDHRKDPAAIAKIIFSNRDAMSYDDLREYLRLLESQSNILDVRIDWSVFQPEQIVAIQHEKMMGLQIADAVASGMWYAVEKNPLGFTEPRYARILKPVIYRHRGVARGYGVKFWPRDLNRLLEVCPEVEELIRLFK